MKRSRGTKLTLNRETLRNLSGTELRRAMAGALTGSVCDSSRCGDSSDPDCTATKAACNLTHLCAPTVTC